MKMAAITVFFLKNNINSKGGNPQPISRGYYDAPGWEYIQRTQQ